MRATTRSFARSTIVAVLTAMAALIIGVTQMLTTAVTASLGLTAVQALIVPGTGTPDAAPDYIDNVVDYYLVPEGKCADNTVANCPTTGIKYFATFWPIPLPGGVDWTARSGTCPWPTEWITSMTLTTTQLMTCNQETA